MSETHSRPFPRAWQTQLIQELLNVYTGHTGGSQNNHPPGCTKPPPDSTSCTSPWIPANISCTSQCMSLLEKLHPTTVPLRHIHSHTLSFITHKLRLKLTTRKNQLILTPRWEVYVLSWGGTKNTWKSRAGCGSHSCRVWAGRFFSCRLALFAWHSTI